jgi:hypothetical protein
MERSVCAANLEEVITICPKYSHVEKVFARTIGITHTRKSAISSTRFGITSLAFNTSVTEDMSFLVYCNTGLRTVRVDRRGSWLDGHMVIDGHGDLGFVGLHTFFLLSGTDGTKWWYGYYDE